MNAAEWDAHNKRLKELTDDILNKLRKGYHLAPNTQGRITIMNPNNAETAIEQPFAEAEDAPIVLTADNIISRTETDGETLAYEVVHDGELLFSTVSRPLAFAFVAGWNGKAGHGGAKPSRDNSEKSEEKADPANPAIVHPARISASKAAIANDDKGASPDKVQAQANQPPQSRKRALL
jgi:hypothetical protein